MNLFTEDSLQASSEASLRFAVLHHRVPCGDGDKCAEPNRDASDSTAQATVARGDHLDWLFELESGGEQLWTCATPIVQLATANEIPMVRLPDHRRLYLDYDGPVSNNRGNVTRIAFGTHRILRSESSSQAGASEIPFRTVASVQPTEALNAVPLPGCLELLFQSAPLQSIHWYCDSESSERVRNTAGIVWDGFLTIQRCPGALVPDGRESARR